jgi:hypothetical protein
MYGAVFGSDVADVAAWMQIAIKSVDYEKGLVDVFRFPAHQKSVRGDQPNVT